MELTLPNDFPTFQLASMLNWTWPNNVFHLMNLTDSIIDCRAAPERQAAGADHVPVETVLELCTMKVREEKWRNFRNVDWEKFKLGLRIYIPYVDLADEITTQEQIDQATEELMQVIQQSIDDHVSFIKHSPNSQMWWTHDLTAMKK
ncbi:hypothetical protein L218DRAFT_878509, partial [Marasmius fiardii PR-910]